MEIRDRIGVAVERKIEQGFHSGAYDHYQLMKWF